MAEKTRKLTRKRTKVVKKILFPTKLVEDFCWLALDDKKKLLSSLQLKPNKDTSWGTFCNSHLFASLFGHTRTLRLLLACVTFESVLATLFAQVACTCPGTNFHVSHRKFLVDNNHFASTTCVSVWPGLASTCVDLRWLFLDRDEISTQIKASFSPFGHPTFVNATLLFTSNTESQRAR